MHGPQRRSGRRGRRSTSARRPAAGEIPPLRRDDGAAQGRAGHARPAGQPRRTGRSTDRSRRTISAADVNCCANAIVALICSRSWRGHASARLSMEFDVFLTVCWNLLVGGCGLLAAVTLPAHAAARRRRAATPTPETEDRADCRTRRRRAFRAAAADDGDRAGSQRVSRVRSAGHAAGRRRRVRASRFSAPDACRGGRSSISIRSARSATRRACSIRCATSRAACR